MHTGSPWPGWVQSHSGPKLRSDAAQYGGTKYPKTAAPMMTKMTTTAASSPRVGSGQGHIMHIPVVQPQLLLALRIERDRGHYRSCREDAR